MTSLNFAVTGANGQVGAFLVEYLRQRGHIVYELVRNQEKAKNPIYFKYFDLADATAVPNLKNIDVLIHTAYFFDTTAKNYQKINEAGTLRLFNQAKCDQVKYPIFISTVSAHANATSLYGKIKYRLEQQLAKQFSQIAIIRPGLIFHEPLQGITAAMDNFVKKFSVVPLIGNGKQLIFPCYLNELCQLIYTLALKQPRLTQPLTAAASQAITFKQLIYYLAKQRKKSVLLVPIPFFSIYGILKMLEFFRIKFGLRSDSLLGLQYANPNNDFTGMEQFEVHFSSLGI